jgi:para-aminobenzoate synthetase component I
MLKTVSRNKAIQVMNQFGRQSRPFLFIIDFECQNSIIQPLDELDNSEIKFAINTPKKLHSKDLILKKYPIPFEIYQKAFDYVHQNLIIGNSFLINLTCPSPIEINLSLEEIYEISDAKYKLWLKDKFVCFSPEIFVKIDKNGLLSSYPMKGTIDASLSDAKNLILNDKKELWEHTTIVDLIRNDVSQVAEKVWVEKFRYIDRIQKHDGGELLQVSSQINGSLSSDWKNNLGNIFFKMLPAGSITGAPKDSTIRIIKEAELSLQSAVHSQQLAVGNSQSAVGSWQSSVGNSQSAVGSWQFTIGSWKLAVSRITE